MERLHFAGVASSRPYHHRHLRQALLDSAVVSIARSGPAALSLRDLARRAGVSHAAPAHHFGDKAGLLTAVAIDGFLELGAVLRAAQPAGLLEMGVAYVHFALERSAYFEVMYRPELYNRDDPALVAARQAAGAPLYGATDGLSAAIAAWSLVHGLATLWLNGNLPPALGDDAEAVVRAVGAHLFRT
jgi:AcrR family transcriptional regulator